MNRSNLDLSWIPIPALPLSSILFFVVYEIFGAHPMPLWFYIGFAVFVSVGLYLAAKNLSFKILVSIFMVYYSALFILHYTPWTSRKFFLNNFKKIERGMPSEQVYQIMIPCSIRSETRNRGAVTILYFWHSEDRHFNTDLGSVYLHDGKVIDTSFMLD